MPEPSSMMRTAALLLYGTAMRMLTGSIKMFVSILIVRWHASRSGTVTWPTL